MTLVQMTAKYNAIASRPFISPEDTAWVVLEYVPALMKNIGGYGILLHNANDNVERQGKYIKKLRRAMLRIKREEPRDSSLRFYRSWVYRILANALGGRNA